MTIQKENHDPYLFEVSLKLILKNTKGEILALEMPKHSSMDGYYDVPGGRINSDELKMSYDEIFKRETREEIGKSVNYRVVNRPVSISRHPYYSSKYQKEMYILFIFFEALYLSGKITTSNEHVAYKWLKLTRKNISTYFVRGLYEGFNNYLKRY